MLTFEESGHIYRWDDKIVPSVTQILRDQGIHVISDFSTGPETGAAVHNAINLLELGGYIPANHPAEIEPYMAAYVEFKKAVDLQIKATEMRVYSEAYEYAGCLDILALINTNRGLIDIKTGVPNPATPVQIAGYWSALPPKIKTGIGCYSLHLKADGKYKLDKIKPMDLLAAQRIFLGALSTWKFRENHGLIE